MKKISTNSLENINFYFLYIVGLRIEMNKIKNENIKLKYENAILRKKLSDIYDCCQKQLNLIK